MKWTDDWKDGHSPACVQQRKGEGTLKLTQTPLDSPSCHHHHGHAAPALSPLFLPLNSNPPSLPPPQKRKGYQRWKAERFARTNIDVNDPAPSQDAVPATWFTCDTSIMSQTSVHPLIWGEGLFFFLQSTIISVNPLDCGFFGGNVVKRGKEVGNGRDLIPPKLFFGMAVENSRIGRRRVGPGSLSVLATRNGRSVAIEYDEID